TSLLDKFEWELPYLPCRLLKYRAKDFGICERRRFEKGKTIYLSFVGDSRIRYHLETLLDILRPFNLSIQTFEGDKISVDDFLGLKGNSQWAKYKNKVNVTSSDLPGLFLEFIWAPNLHRGSKTPVKGSKAPVSESEASLKGSKIRVKRSKTFVKGNKTPARESKFSVKGSKPPVKGSKTFVKGSKTTVKRNKIPVKGSKPPVKGSKVSVKGSKTFVKGNKTPMKGSKTPVKGSKIPMKGSKSHVRGKSSVKSKARKPLKGDNTTLYRQLDPKIGAFDELFAKSLLDDELPDIIFISYNRSGTWQLSLLKTFYTILTKWQSQV
ncbi:hypothetical protein Avbf_16020, partial [Armadillidium vulgare]